MSPTDDRQRWLALYVLCAGMLMIVLDATIVNVALPTIQKDLHFTQANLAWVVNAYLISFGGLLLLGGRLGDLIGQRRVFLVGLAIFTLASVACAAAPGQGFLVGARFVQGLGGALTSAVVLSMIVTMFPDPRDQAKALGVYGFVASAGGSIGLLAGGALTQAINWHWIFIINVPVGILTAVLAVRLVADRPGLGLKAGADVPGAIVLIAGLMLGVYTILEVAHYGWGSLHTIGLGAISMALVAAFLVRQALIETPLIPLRIFRVRTVAGANVVQALLVAGMFAMFFQAALYLQRILGYDALQVGLAFLPTTLVMGTMSLKFAQPATMRFGARSVLVVSLASIGAGLVLFSATPVHGDYVTQIMPSLLLLGFGAGIGFPALVGMAMSGATPEDSGLASGLVNTSAQVGGAIGLAVLATLATQRANNLIADGTSHAQALNSGYHLAYLVGAALVGVAIVITLTVLRPEGRVSPGTEPAASPGRP